MKIRKKKHKKQRVKFYKKILEKNIRGEEIFFTDETLIKLRGYTMIISD